MLIIESLLSGPVSFFFHNHFILHSLLLSDMLPSVYAKRIICKSYIRQFIREHQQWLLFMYTKTEFDESY